MRKVMYKKWIDKKHIEENGCLKIQVGTNCWEEGYPNAGTFHQWANAYEESSAGFGNFTVALVENPDGTISQVLPSNLKFMEEEK